MPTHRQKLSVKAWGKYLLVTVGREEKGGRRKILDPEQARRSRGIARFPTTKEMCYAVVPDGKEGRRKLEAREVRVDASSRGGSSEIPKQERTSKRSERGGDESTSSPAES